MNTGIEKAREAALAVGGLVAIPEMDGAKCDFNDLHQERGPDAVKAAIENAHQVTAAASTPESSHPRKVETWPVDLDDAAFIGLAGEIVREIEPRTEADSAAILLQVLVCFGALVGKGPHVPIEGDQHHGNLFALLIGETSKGRKGTSWGRVREIFSKVEGFPAVVDGLSSGEGLKWAVRDPVKKIEKGKDGFAQEVEADPGVSDKRLLVVESEFAQVLRQAARAGNTLSATIRSAWDSGTLRTLTKHDAITATGAHICIVGHITADELRAELTQTDSANGFANRFLFMCVRRAKKLPFGGAPLSADVIGNFASRIARAAGKARSIQAVDWTDAAREVWKAVYPTVSEGRPGLFGCVTGRSEAQCIRLALIYALMDESAIIDRQHLLAALAIWERAESSARYVFGDALGNPVADDILRALRVARQDGLTRTTISNLFNRHQTAERIGAGLELLMRRGLARHESRQTGGAPAEVWVCV